MPYSSEDQLRYLTQRLEAAEAKLNLIYSSKLWKLTYPLRKFYKKAGLSQALERKQHLESSSEGSGELILNSAISSIKHLKSIEISESNKVAVLASWSKSNLLSGNIKQLIFALLKCDYSVVLVSANDSILIDEELKNLENLAVLTKANIGYDFGSWLCALHAYPEIFKVKDLILANDSCIGPFGDFDSVISKLESSKFQVTSLTDSVRGRYHLQSYFLHFKMNKNIETVLRNFFLELKTFSSKSEMILNYEMGLTLNLQSSGIKCGALFPWNLYSSPWNNPTLDDAISLLEAGFPFIKKELIRLKGKAELEAINKVFTKNFGFELDLKQVID